MKLKKLTRSGNYIMPAYYHSEQFKWVARHPEDDAQRTLRGLKDYSWSRYSLADESLRARAREEFSFTACQTEDHVVSIDGISGKSEGEMDKAVNQLENEAENLKKLRKMEDDLKQKKVTPEIEVAAKGIHLDAGFIFSAVAMASDFAQSYSLFEAVFILSVYENIVAAIVFVLGADFSLYLAGNKTKELKQGLATKKEVVIINVVCWLAFLICFILFAFSVFENSSVIVNTTGIESSVTQSGDSSSVFAACLLKVGLVLATSIMSFIMSYVKHDVLKSLENKMQQTIKRNLKKINRLHQQLTETDPYENAKMLIDIERDRLDIINRSTVDQYSLCSSVFCSLLCRKLTPVDAEKAKESSKEMTEKGRKTLLEDADSITSRALDSFESRLKNSSEERKRRIEKIMESVKEDDIHESY